MYLFKELVIVSNTNNTHTIDLIVLYSLHVVYYTVNIRVMHASVITMLTEYTSCAGPALDFSNI